MFSLPSVRENKKYIRLQLTACGVGTRETRSKEHFKKIGVLEGGQQIINESNSIVIQS